MNNKKWAVIANPNAGNRRLEKDLPGIENQLQKAGIHYNMHLTNGKHHATELTTALIKDGINQIICIGGDGTLNEIVNGIFNQKIIPCSEILLSIIPVGMGNDWCRTHQIPFDYEKAIQLISSGSCMMHDIGKVSFDYGNGIISRYFINVAGMGFDAEVAASVNELKLTRPGAGKWVYLQQLFMCLLKSKSKRVNITIDDDRIEAEIFSISIGNCRYNGGGMQQLPYASPEDGLYDMIIIRKVGIKKVLMNIHKLFNGKIDTIKEVSMHRGMRIMVECNEPLMLECDGENIGQQPYIFYLLPQAVQVISGIKKKDRTREQLNS